jgi:hypothetical protein
MSLFRRHARAEYGHGAGQSRAAILRNAPHQTQCELNDAELEVVAGGMDADFSSASTAMKTQDAAAAADREAENRAIMQWRL